MAYVQADESTLSAADYGASDYFGYAVSVNSAGTVMVVSAPSWDATFSDQGGVYTYDLIGDVWTQRGSVLVAGDAAVSDSFGRSVALSGDGNYLVVGSLRSSASTSRVYCYSRSGSTWVQDGSALAPPALANNRIGWSVAISDDLTVLAIGAINRNPTYTNQGAVFIYDKIASVWTQRGSELVAGDASAEARFGWSVSLRGDGLMLAVGAPYATASVSGQGKVYIYDWSGSAWVVRGSYLVAPDAAVNDRFGIALSLAGDSGEWLAVGAPHRNPTGSDLGAVYFYSWSGSAWTHNQTLTPLSPADTDLFGSSVGIAGNGSFCAIGAPFREYSALTDVGVVYLYPNDSYVPPEPEEVITISEPHIYMLSAYISGAEDTLDDYAFSISSLGLSKRNADTSYYAISAPLTGDLMDALIARPNGLIYILRDGAVWEYFNIAAPIRYDIGPRSASINISGTRQETNIAPAEHTIATHMVTSEAINSSGLLTLGIIPGYLDPMPGDTVSWDGADYTLTLIKYQANSAGQTLNYTCEPVV